ncbi:MAG: hypothetical protein RBS40_04855 [Rhodocyclaceae bacterium]|jgi:hypothetical protein|nr:hypothetical protein [Rhodocyclaceae bacterium]
MLSNECIRPPGTYYDIVAHPTDADKSIEIAVVQDHRFAFFYWMKWRNRQEKSSPPPTLVSLDWHQDLVSPDELECEWLRALDMGDYKAAAFFCWDKLHCANDGHLLAAAYLNLIGDIHIVKKQQDDYGDVFVDRDGRTHRVRCYDSMDALVEAVSLQEHESVILDIDLDYFTESTDAHGGGADLQLVPDGEIEACLNASSPFMSWVLPRLAGMTIATEPEFCGGLANSHHLLDIVNKTLFDPGLLRHHAAWRQHFA